MHSILKLSCVSASCLMLVGFGAAPTPKANAAEPVAPVVVTIAEPVLTAPDYPPFHPTSEYLCSICHGAGGGGMEVGEFTSFDSIPKLRRNRL